MNIIKKISMVIILMGILMTFSSFGIEASAQDRGRRHQGPPPEAYTACEGKSAGDTAEFEGPNGDTVTGICTCEEDGDRLVLRPDNPPGGGGRNHPNE